MGANGAGLEEYMASGTYTPTVTVTGTGTASLTTGSLGWSRVGNVGGAAAGDTVIVFGVLDLSGMVDNDVVNIPLPFEAALVAFHGGAALLFDTTMAGFVTLGGATTAVLGVTVTDDDTCTGTFSVTYQTANAIDP